MNKRIRKKRAKNQKLGILVVRCTKSLSQEQYVKVRKSIEYQLQTGQVVILPSFVELEGIFRYGSKEIAVEVRSNEETKKEAI